MAREDAQLRIRVPEDVKEWLEQQAAKNLRTQSAEIVLAIRARMEEHRATSGSNEPA
ncbi:MAG: hypothetical protein LDL44_00625 [Caenispirillum sp.]|nr:hypothetical protein [Caenispirillum sp.]